MYESARQALQKIIEIIERIESRCMAADGPVTPTIQEIIEADLREIYWIAKSCVDE